MFFSNRKKSLHHYPIKILIAFSLLIISLLSSCSKKQIKTENSQELLSSGWAEFRLGEYKKAIQIFSLVAFSPDTDKKIRPHALYGLACSHWQKLPDADKPLAIKLFKQIIEEYPDSEFAVWSELALIRMEHIVSPGEKADYPTLRKKYMALFEKYPNTLPGHEGFVYMLSTYIASFDNKNDIEKGFELADEFLNKFPDSPYASSIWSLRAKACQILKKPDEQLKSMIMSLKKRELDPTNPKMENAGTYWAIATTAEFEVGDFITAKKYYQLLIDEYPQEKRRFAAITAIKRINELLKKFDEEITQ
ncbi:MAG TPA: tetratricopeptide repeat protein [Victivallales bacterium]|nr:tetratricopeptide repeat protein [Victivallales bacterium]HRU00206.1 tetratricopeptide repeat protein [Victivallales bacterium]